VRERGEDKVEFICRKLGLSRPCGSFCSPEMMSTLQAWCGAVLTWCVGDEVTPLVEKLHSGRHL
jgi:hypothetical protein